MKRGTSITGLEQAEAISAFREGRSAYDYETGDTLIETQHDPLKRLREQALHEHDDVTPPINVLQLVPTTIAGKVLSVLHHANRPLTQAEIRYEIRNRFGFELAPDAVGSALSSLTNIKGKVTREGNYRFFKYRLTEKVFESETKSTESIASK